MLFPRKKMLFYTKHICLKRKYNGYVNVVLSRCRNLLIDEKTVLVEIYSWRRPDSKFIQIKIKEKIIKLKLKLDWKKNKQKTKEMDKKILKNGLAPL